VETGAAITDHAFHLPYEVQMRVGFSDSSHQAVGFVKMVYQKLIALQQSREPMNVSTGKRLYQNMLIQTLQVTTDVENEYALNLTASLREIIITNTSTTSGTGSDPSTQSTPSQTSDTSDQGSQSVRSANGGDPTHYDPPPQIFEPGGAPQPPVPPDVTPAPPLPPSISESLPLVQDPWTTVGAAPAQPGPMGPEGIPPNTTGSAEEPVVGVGTDIPP
jgi:hypothetical protein